MTSSLQASALYRTLWRWHFYAGVCVLPLIVLLSLSGAVFLFKPQIERWEERAFQGLPLDHATSPAAQWNAARAAFPGSTAFYYRLPERPGDAAMVHLALPDGTMTDAFVSPQGQVLGSLSPDRRIIAVDRKIHGQLLLGPRGSWIVELAASWAIVLIVTGLFLWWPRGRGLAGTLWPRLSRGRRVFWRDLHAVTGFWVAGLALVLLFTGLPWAGVWGSAFKAVRQEMGWTRGAQDWTIGGRPAHGGGEHADHDHAAMMAGMAIPGMARPSPDASSEADPARFDRIVERAAAAHLAFPVLVVPPGMPAGEGGSGKPAKDWVVRSDAQNRPLRVTLHFDDAGTLHTREDIAGKHPIDRIVAYGVAWHQGQLLGWVNQMIGLLTAAMLVTMTVSGFVLWRRRKPAGALGAPPAFSRPARLRGIGAWALVVFLLAWLPMFTLSLVCLLGVERWVLPHWPGVARWLGLAPKARAGRMGGGAMG
jgi:uncharacterized iron-regulated membrane protein